jgi:hypothetical protein
MKQLPVFTKARTTFFLLILTLPLLLITASSVEANHLYACSNRYAWWWVQIGGQWRHAKGQMCAGQLPESGNGHCYIRTYVDPATPVNYVGWTNWQCDLMQNGIVVSSYQVGGQVNWNSDSKQASSTWSNAYWTGRYVRISGQHDANHNGANPSPWRATNYRDAQH